MVEAESENVTRVAELEKSTSIFGQIRKANIKLRIITFRDVNNCIKQFLLLFHSHQNRAFSLRSHYYLCFLFYQLAKSPASLTTYLLWAVSSITRTLRCKRQARCTIARWAIDSQTISICEGRPPKCRQRFHTTYGRPIDLLSLDK